MAPASLFGITVQAITSSWSIKQGSDYPPHAANHLLVQGNDTNDQPDAYHLTV